MVINSAFYIANYMNINYHFGGPSIRLEQLEYLVAVGKNKFVHTNSKYDQRITASNQRIVEKS